MNRRVRTALLGALAAGFVAALALAQGSGSNRELFSRHERSTLRVSDEDQGRVPNFDGIIRANMERMLREGRRIFRFDTFGDEAFWGDTLKLHRAIEGSALGGVGRA